MSNDFVPNFLEHSLFKKSSNFCVFVFVINEGVKLHKQLDQMKNHAEYIDIVVVDGGSTDGSIDLAALKELNVNTVLIKNESGKLGTQMLIAFSWAILNGYDGVVVVDGNGKDDISAIPRFLEKLKQGFDHIQGSRYIAGGYHLNTPILRNWGVRLLHAPMLSLFSGFRYTDTTNGFRAYSVGMLKDPRVGIFRPIFSGYEVHYYLAYRASKIGLKCIEIPVKRVYPATGKTPTKISPIKGNFEVLYKLFKVCMGRYNPRLTKIRSKHE